MFLIVFAIDMDTCYLCPEQLTSGNESSEHIILNSLGGQLKSKSLLCKECNNVLGHSIDNELTSQLQFLAVLLDVIRDKKNHPTLNGWTDVNGKAYSLKAGGVPVAYKPTNEIIKNPDGSGTINISAKDKHEMKQLINYWKKKGIEIDINSATIGEEMSGRLTKKSHTIGGDLAFRAICKTAINAYLHFGGERKHITHLINYINGEKNMDIVYPYPSMPFFKLEKNEVLHTILIKGDKTSGLLYSLVEFFSSCSYIVILNDNYDGEEFECQYSYDLYLNKEVNKAIEYNFSRVELETLEYSADMQAIMSIRISNIMKVARTWQMEKKTNEIITTVFEKYKNSEGEVPVEKLSEFNKELRGKLAEYITKVLVQSQNDKGHSIH